MQVGVDFDNTIVYYDDLFLSAAADAGLIDRTFRGSKREVRDRIRMLPDGEAHWQRLQAQVYGVDLLRAPAFKGFDTFLESCKARAIPVYVVSHKSAFAFASPEGPNLRDAASAWLVARFPSDAFAGVYFEESRAAKLARIESLRLSHFIDDLSDVLLDPAFPADVSRWLFDPSAALGVDPRLRSFSSWQSIDARLASEQQVSATVESLLGEPLASLTPCRPSGNNRVYRVRTLHGVYAVKSYGLPDERGRFAREYSALTFLQATSLRGSIAQPIACDRSRGVAVYEWIDGDAIDCAGDAIDAMIAFAIELKSCSATGDAKQLSDAADAVFTGRTLVHQVRQRLARFSTIALVESELGEVLARINAELERQIARASLDVDLDRTLPEHERTLSPSDFGYHNALRRGDATIFLDFEYFGWDDPVKLTADVLLHPAMELDPADKRKWLESMSGLFDADARFLTRFSAMYGLYALKWCVILLNEFLPAGWERRRGAGATLSWEVAKASQLAKIRGRLTELEGMSTSAHAADLDERSRYLRGLIVDALEGGNRGHVGAALSLVEIVRVLYDSVLRVRPSEPQWIERDRFILSKGHGCLALYAVLADAGFFEVSALREQCRPDALLGGHPEIMIPGVEASTGALGHGLAIGVGMALAARIAKRDSRVFVVTGDGELDEGSVWEAALSAAKHKLANLTLIVDHNKLQSFGLVEDVLPLGNLPAKLRAFGFEVREVDGHDVAALKHLFTTLPFSADRPSAVIAHTLKGRGVPAAEQNAAWHHKNKITPEDLKLLREALER